MTKLPTLQAPHFILSPVPLPHCWEVMWNPTWEMQWLANRSPCFYPHNAADLCWVQQPSESVKMLVGICHYSEPSHGFWFPRLKVKVLIMVSRALWDLSLHHSHTTTSLYFMLPALGLSLLKTRWPCCYSNPPGTLLPQDHYIAIPPARHALPADIHLAPTSISLGLYLNITFPLRPLVIPLKMKIIAPPTHSHTLIPFSWFISPQHL